jgi:predicted MPP superfamily phosphohydrolase
MVFIRLLCFCGFVIGHIANLSYSLNWWYGQRLSHRFLSRVRHLHGALVVAGIAGVAWLFWQGFTPGQTFGAESSWVMSLAAGYTLWCLSVGFVIVPFLSLYRWLRPRPKAFIRSQSKILDVARTLGYRPLGRGRYHHSLARLPGNQIYQVEISEKTFAFPRLPKAWHGLTILHLTDLHFHGTPDRVFFQTVLDACMAQTPDLVAITGDVIDSHWHHRWISPILGRLRWKEAGVAILGNHDRLWSTGQIRRRLTKLGLQMVQNRWIELTIRGEPMTVIGHQGPWFRPAPDLRNCPEGPFRFCLSHTPDNIRWARANKIDLMLSGHNHGGQIRFPFIGSVLVPSVYSRRYDGGVYWEEPTLLHVCRGLSGQHPLRYNCRPEVTLITLEKREG